MATRFEVDASSSRVTFHAASSVHPIDVDVREVEGHVHAVLDGDELRLEPPGRFTVPLEHLRSGNRVIDRETRRRLDVDRHPEIVAELTEAVRADPDGGPFSDGSTTFDARGRVTVSGVSREVEGRLHVERLDGDRLRITGEGSFDVRRWEIDPPSLVVVKVHPTVEVRVELEARTRG